MSIFLHSLFRLFPSHDPKKEIDLTNEPCPSEYENFKKDRVTEQGRYMANKKRAKPFLSSKERQEISETSYGEKCSLIDLKPSQCCFPIGDPKDHDFGFCGGEKETQIDVYCEQHKKLSYDERKSPSLE